MNKNGNPKTLKPFKKGNDPRRNITGKNAVLPELKEAMALLLSTTTADKTNLEKLLNSLYLKALKGSEKAAELILKYAYGDPKQAIDITSAGEKINFNPQIFVSPDKT